MPEIDLGVDFSDVKDEDKYPVVPNGTYPFIVKGVESVRSQNTNRPMLKWKLEITDPQTQRPLVITHNTVLPWTPPGGTELVTSGVGMLVQICKAIGKPWTGKTIQTEEYLGQTGRVMIVQAVRNIKDPATGQYIPDPDGDVRNEVSGFDY